MYDRKIDGKLFDFEASGALYHNALVMQDDQTSSFWAVISSRAIGGPKQGTKLHELPISQKTTWKDWLKKHPETLLLSVDGQVHLESNPYDNYFTSEKTFRPVDRPDERLPPKTSVFTLVIEEKAYAISHQSLASGWQGEVEGMPVFIYREEGDSIYRSTKAYKMVDKNGEPVKLYRKRKQWVAASLGRFHPDSGNFGKDEARVEPLQGLDTFWYIWSQYYPRTTLLDAAEDAGK